jgi:TP53 regulating kinase-like protein
VQDKLLAEAVGLLEQYDARAERVLGVGAEAVVVKCEWRGFEAVAKLRLAKPYRDPALDALLRSRRTALEAKLMFEARKLGVAAPAPLFVDAEEGLLIMDYIPGPRLRDVLARLESREEVFETVGFYAGLIHGRGIVHGDLTAANVIVSDGGVYVIDFGLGAFSNDLEEQGVDVHLMLRSLESTHPSLAPQLYRAFMRGYAKARGEEARKLVESKVLEIRRRGRYVAERRRRAALA